MRHWSSYVEESLSEPCGGGGGGGSAYPASASWTVEGTPLSLSPVSSTLVRPPRSSNFPSFLPSSAATLRNRWCGSIQSGRYFRHVDLSPWSRQRVSRLSSDSICNQSLGVQLVDRSPCRPTVGDSANIGLQKKNESRCRSRAQDAAVKTSTEGTPEAQSALVAFAMSPLERQCPCPPRMRDQEQPSRRSDKTLPPLPATRPDIGAPDPESGR